ncbi:hypothetical protein [Sulfitobacter sp. SK011]|uniref:hypothetical protein n=1 Tax=Sulfitobacter sp. SK011 TaxID=1389004 RepID=UPI000E0AD4E0|nr:hypothetical protein [Sulfitobacter sp. SK011]AXI43128.1 hypothetical protein C1J02_15185 [Sulfitobacter sp. SK011]
MTPPKSFYDFTLQFHQDLDVVHPGWAETPDGRNQIYEDFRQGYGDKAVLELATYCEELLADSETDLGSFWLAESKADLVIQDEGVRFLFNDFLGWMGSLS